MIAGPKEDFYAYANVLTNLPDEQRRAVIRYETWRGLLNVLTAWIGVSIAYAIGKGKRR